MSSVCELVSGSIQKNFSQQECYTLHLKCPRFLSPFLVVVCGEAVELLGPAA